MGMSPEPQSAARSSPLIPWAAFALLFAAFGLIFRPFFPLPGGRMGHDFSLALPAWLDGFAWFKNNGLAPPWFSPSFCAGQPFFPDPQSAYYSLPQFLDILAGPVDAAYWTLLAAAALIFWGGYLLMRRVFATGVTPALLVGGLLMFNGFLPQRMIVGHIGFHSFALTPWLALLLLLPVRRAADGVMAALAGGMLLAYWVQSGFGTLILPGALSVVLLAAVYGLGGGSMGRFAARGALAGLVSLGLSAAKLSATFAFLSNFPRTFYPLPGAATLHDALIMIAGALFLPSQWAFALGSHRLVNVEWLLAPHEWAYNFGIAAALLAVVLAGDRLRRRPWRLAPTPRRLGLWLILLFGLIWPVAFNVWQPGWNAFLKSLPIIDSTSAPIRWVIVYIPIFAVSLGLLLQRARWGRAGNWVAALCLLATVLQTALEPRGFYLAQGYDARPIAIADRLLRAGRFAPEIKALGTAATLRAGAYRAQLRGNDAFISGVSQVFCYNPVFGYRLEKFSAAGLVTGPVLAARDGFLNLKNPACYVYPQENGCRAGDRFRADQLTEARSFVHYRPFPFQVSAAQRFAGAVSEASLLALLLAALVWLPWSMFRLLRSHGRDIGKSKS